MFEKIAHGGENVKTALRDSCNIFFYNCAMRLGISKIDEYATAFGLGEKTGVEIAESSGILASPENRENNGGIWNAGDTLQTAIGQVITFSLLSSLQTTAQQLQTAEQDMSFTL